MLKLTIGVQSGIKAFHTEGSKDKSLDNFKLHTNGENRNMFLQGILLFLMGERVSQYALKKPIDDPLWLEQQTHLEHYLADISLKGRIKTISKSYDVMSFSQHRKHGVLLHSLYKVGDNELTSLGERSRLFEKYISYIKDGLFDVFFLPDAELDTLLHGKSWSETKDKLNNVLTSVLSKISSNADKDINAELAKELTNALANIFKKIMPLSSEKLSNNPYRSIMLHFTKNAKALIKIKYLEKKKQKGEALSQQDTIDLSEAEKLLNLNQIRLSYFMWRYLNMCLDIYAEKEENKKQSGKLEASSFGINELNFKKKRAIQGLQQWLDDLHRAPKPEPNINGASEFFKGVFSLPKYNVSTHSPVKNIRYDGVFELFVQTTPEKEQDIKQRIENSHRWYLRVGKLCYAKLMEMPERIPSKHWQEAKDDILDQIEIL